MTSREFKLSIFAPQNLLAVPVYLLVLTVLVFIHEMGHFLVARWNGVAVQTFSIGFGPEIAGFNDRLGTRWRIAAIPLGGYVRFVGDMNASSMPDSEVIANASPELRKSLFVNKNVWQRIAVVAAGPAVNLVFAFLVLYFSLLAYGRYEVPPVIDSVSPPSLTYLTGRDLLDPNVSMAYGSGIRGGDEFVSVDGFETRSFDDVRRLIETAPERPITIVILRGGERLTFVVTTGSTQRIDRFGNTQRVGLLGVLQRVAEYRLFRPNPLEAVSLTLDQIHLIVDRTVAFIGDFFVGRGDFKQLGGPVEIARTAGQVATLGVPAVILFAGFVSLSLGIFNLLPIPILDGGHILFYLIEAVRRRPLSPQVQEMGFRLGMALIFTLLVTITVTNTIPTMLGLR